MQLLAWIIFVTSSSGICHLPSFDYLHFAGCCAWIGLNAFCTSSALEWLRRTRVWSNLERTTRARLSGVNFPDRWWVRDKVKFELALTDVGHFSCSLEKSKNLIFLLYFKYVKFENMLKKSMKSDVPEHPSPCPS